MNSDKSSDSQPTKPTNPTKKNKPTPKRKDAEAARNISSLSPGASREDKKRLKEINKSRRLAARAAYMRGDENALPARDKGPAKRFVRNYVDARRSIGEYFLVLIIIVLFMSAIPVKQIQVLSIAMIYSSIIYSGIDGFFLSRKIKKLVREKFPTESTRGLGLYAWLRSTQMRRLRAPAPQRKPGESVE